jgi:hypothetical protein
MSAPHLAWAKGGEASFLTAEDDAVTLRSTIPSPPGSRLEGKLLDGAVPIKIKIHGSKLEPDGSYTLKGRLLDANRATRDLIAALTSVREG